MALEKILPIFENLKEKVNAEQINELIYLTEYKYNSNTAHYLSLCEPKSQQEYAFLVSIMKELSKKDIPLILDIFFTQEISFPNIIKENYLHALSSGEQNVLFLFFFGINEIFLVKISDYTLNENPYQYILDFVINKLDSALLNKANNEIKEEINELGKIIDLVHDQSLSSQYDFSIIPSKFDYITRKYVDDDIYNPEGFLDELREKRSWYEKHIKPTLEAFFHFTKNKFSNYCYMPELKIPSYSEYISGMIRAKSEPYISLINQEIKEKEFLISEKKRKLKLYQIPAIKSKENTYFNSKFTSYRKKILDLLNDNISTEEYRFAHYAAKNKNSPDTWEVRLKFPKDNFNPKIYIDLCLDIRDGFDGGITLELRLFREDGFVDLIGTSGYERASLILKKEDVIKNPSFCILKSPDIYKIVPENTPDSIPTLDLFDSYKNKGYLYSINNLVFVEIWRNLEAQYMLVVAKIFSDLPQLPYHSKAWWKFDQPCLYYEGIWNEKALIQMFPHDDKHLVKAILKSYFDNQ